MNKELDRIVANAPDGLKNNPIFKELVNEVTKDKENHNSSEKGKLMNFIAIGRGLFILHLFVDYNKRHKFFH